jgi:Transposase, Mutator family
LDGAALFVDEALLLLSTQLFEPLALGYDVRIRVTGVALPRGRHAADFSNTVCTKSTNVRVLPLNKAVLNRGGHEVRLCRRSRMRYQRLPTAIAKASRAVIQRDSTQVAVNGLAANSRPRRRSAHKAAADALQGKWQPVLRALEARFLAVANLADNLSTHGSPEVFISVAVIVTVAVNTDGVRQVLGMAVCPSDAETFWTNELPAFAHSARPTHGEARVA